MYHHGARCHYSEHTMRGLRPLYVFARDLSAVAALESRLIQPCSILNNLRDFSAFLSPAAGDYPSAVPHRIIRDCPWSAPPTTPYISQLLLARQVFVFVLPAIDPDQSDQPHPPVEFSACTVDQYIWLATDRRQQRRAARQSREGACSSSQLGGQAASKSRAVCEADTPACSHRYNIKGYLCTRLVQLICSAQSQGTPIGACSILSRPQNCNKYHGMPFRGCSDCLTPHNVSLWPQ